MKTCPQCFRTYPADARFCPVDGVALVSSSLPPPPSEDRRVGMRLCGRYDVRRIVADGGMGRVYEGIDRVTSTRIAIKVLHEEVAKDEVPMARFKREYEISKNLSSEHVVKVLDFQRDPEADAWLLVMEFLDGEELRHLLKREKFLAPERVIRMLSHVALGLDDAHSNQLIHRDLKPDNLFLCGSREGELTKILDFGSVKDKNQNAAKLTVMGTTIGSPFYMAPEQAQGLETLDARADVFALGAITYECIVGIVPFSGSNGPSILLSILTEDPLPPTMRAKSPKYPIPPAMDDIMELALAKNPNLRPKTVGALADAVGHAYGLDGDHRVWAKMPLHELTAKVIAARPGTLVKAAPLVIQADPFAFPAPDPFTSRSSVPLGEEVHETPSPVFTEESSDSSLESQGEIELLVPRSRGWLVPALAGGVVVVLVVVGLLVLR